MRNGLVVLASSLLLLACGSDEPATSGGGGTDGTPTGGESADDTDSAEATSATGAVDEESSGEPPPPFEPYPARGITITEMYADHGVSVPIVQDGQWVDGSGRNAELIRGRTTLIRGFWELEEGWVPREIQGVLTLRYLDGSEEAASRNFFVEGESRPNSLDSNIYFVVPGELMTAGMQFSLELFETAEGYRDQPEPEQLAYPPSPGYVGIEDSEMVLDVVIVPIDHDLSAECPEPPEVTEDELQYMSDQLSQQNPVERVDMVVREPVPYTSGLNSFNGLLGFLADLREQDGADPASYYFGVIRPCDGGPEGVGGQAISIPDSPTVNNAWTRTSVGRWYGSLSSTANTFVHEVGHTQGRRHVTCNGSEGGPNPSYPYPDGDIGVWGFGNVDFSLHSPTSAKDYMTYCGNTWISDWGWSRVVPFVREITSWGSQGAIEPSDGRILVGLIDPHSGDESWFSTRGTTEGLVVEGRETLTLESGDGLTTRVDTVVVPMGDEDAYAVVAPLPEGMELEHQVAITRLPVGAPARPVHEVRTQGRMVTITR